MKEIAEMTLKKYNKAERSKHSGRMLSQISLSSMGMDLASITRVSKAHNQHKNNIKMGINQHRYRGKGLKVEKKKNQSKIINEPSNIQKVLGESKKLVDISKPKQLNRYILNTNGIKGLKITSVARISQETGHTNQQRKQLAEDQDGSQPKLDLQLDINRVVPSSPY